MNRVQGLDFFRYHHDLLWTTRVDDRYHVEVHRDGTNICHMHIWDDDNKQEVSYMENIFVGFDSDEPISPIPDYFSTLHFQNLVDMVIEQWGGYNELE
jgi:hypothetical protein